jgi:hypothetical protein
MGNYTLLPLPVEFLEASLEIIFQNAHQSSWCCIFHPLCTSEMLSFQLRFHNPEEVVVWQQEIRWVQTALQDCHLGIC